MNNSDSQKPSDNSNLFAHCAKDWNSCEQEESLVACEDSPQNTLKKENVYDNQDVQDVQDEQYVQDVQEAKDVLDVQYEQAYQDENLDFVNQESNNSHSFHDYNRDLSIGNLTLTRLYSALELAFTQYTPLSPAQGTVQARELLLIPQKSYNWHLCLMGYHANNILGELDSIESAVCDPLEGVGAWLTEGMHKGWLRYADMHAFVNPYHHSLLPQEAFWKRFTSVCEKRTGRVSLLLFRFADNVSKTMGLCELVEQILVSIKREAFFGEVQGLDVALALPDAGCFRATACAERIMSCMDNILPNTSIEVGVAEAEEDDDAKIMYSHAKEALVKKPEHGLRVQVYRRVSKNKRNNSLVQSDEKRFLFFGVQ